MNLTERIENMANKVDANVYIDDVKPSNKDIKHYETEEDKINKYMNMEYIKVKNTKTFLNKTLIWSSSRYNGYKKKDIVDFIYNISKKEGTFIDEYKIGGFVDNHRNRGCSYIIIKKGSEIRLVVGETVYKLV